MFADFIKIPKKLKIKICYWVVLILISYTNPFNCFGKSVDAQLFNQAEKENIQIDKILENSISQIEQFKKNNSDVSNEDIEKITSNLLNIINKYPNYNQAPVSQFHLAEFYNQLFRKTKYIEYLKISINNYQQLINKYPNQPIIVDVMFNLANLYNISNNNQLAIEQLNLLLNNYPNNKYISVITKNKIKWSNENYNQKSVHLLSAKSKLSNPIKVTSISQQKIGNLIRTIFILSSSAKYDLNKKIVDNDQNLQINLKFNNVQLLKGLTKEKIITQNKLYPLTIPQISDEQVNFQTIISKESKFYLFPFENDGKHMVVMDIEPITIVKKPENKKEEKQSDIDLTESIEIVKNQTNQIEEEIYNIKEDEINNSIIDPISISNTLGLKVRKILIDPGHGGKDPGAVKGNIYEKHITLKLAKLVAQKIKMQLPFVEVQLTRYDDRYLSLEKRAQLAISSQADLFISLHINGHKNPAVNGIESYYLNFSNDKDSLRLAARENLTSISSVNELESVLKNIISSSKSNESLLLSSMVQHSMIESLKLNGYNPNNLGVKQAPFIVLIGTNIPSILLEVGFITNNNELERLNSTKYLNILADSIALGLTNYAGKNGDIAENTRF